MDPTEPSSETGLAERPESCENDGGRPGPALPTEPFPALRAGELVLDQMELVRVHDETALGKYRVQQRALGDEGHVFLVTLFGATASKVAMVSGRTLAWRDYLAAMKRAIEREIGYWQNRGQRLPRTVGRALDVTVRDTDFSVPQ